MVNAAVCTSPLIKMIFLTCKDYLGQMLSFIINCDFQTSFVAVSNFFCSVSVFPDLSLVNHKINTETVFSA